ncbi:MAG TPA: Gfo/Idh/MocA family oxidoreductase [Armatimonadetes bacterium]|nr:Gfo/Idh/MocA family oxidoreductase [Armatimonadota bacterium]
MLQLREGGNSSVLTRREFLRTLGAATAAGWQAGQIQVRAGEGSAEEAAEPIGVGLIGCGGRGSHLGRVLQQLKQQGERVELVAVCDIYRPRLERAAKNFSAKSYPEAHELVRDPDVDAVVVATPDRLHVHHSLAAVQAGKDVYYEKPLTHWQQFEMLKQLVREARRRQLVFQVGTQFLSDSIWHQAAALIKEGALGKPIHAQTGYFRLGDWGERGMPIDDPNAQPGPDLDWEAFLADAPRRPFSVSRFFRWRMYMDYAGGPCTDLYPHVLTPLVKALGVAFPKTVVAIGGKYRYNGEREVPDTFDMLIEYPEGLSVAVLGTIANEWGLETVIRGGEATLTFRGPGLLIQPQKGVKKERREIARQRGASVQEHLRNFLQCVRTREKPYSDLELNYYVQTALIMAMLSFVEGKAAHFDAAAEEIRLS